MVINDSTNLNNICRYIVDPSGVTGRSTIQSAITSANAFGLPALIYVRSGTYTENLTFYDGIILQGDSESNVNIIGTHTPPASGTLNIFRCSFQSATDIFNSAVAGTTSIIMEDCSVNVTNGYTFNLPNWTGSIAVFDIGNLGTNDGFINNTGGAGFFCYSAGFGNGTVNSATLSGTVIITTSDSGCPINFVTGSNVSIDNSSFTNAITFSNNSTGYIANSNIDVSGVAAITMNSSANVSIKSTTISTNNSPAIAGTGAGTLALVGIDYPLNEEKAGTLTLNEDVFSETGEIIAYNIQRQTFTGFYEWTGAGGYWTVAGTNFTLDRPGSGYIKGRKITWAGGQTLSSLAKGNTHFIYIDDTGTIGSVTTRTNTLFEDNIVLFEVLVDNDTPENVFVLKENHPYTSPTDLSNTLHNTIGTAISNSQNGANIVSGAAADEIGISGNDILEDHGLETTISDSAGASETWNFFYTDSGGKWILYSSTATFPSVYNNAGTITALGVGNYGVFRLYVSKDDIETTTPQYIVVIDDAQYNNLNLAQTSIANGSVAQASNELSNLEVAQLGYVIYEQSSSTIVDIIIEKAVVRGNTITSGTNQANLVITDTTNFNGFLSSSDTTVQQALETLDDVKTSPTFNTSIEVDNATGATPAGQPYVITQDTVQTIDAATTTLWSLTLTNDEAIVIEAQIVAPASTYASVVGGNIVACAKKDGAAAAALVGTPIVNVLEDSAGAPTFTIDVSGNDVRLRVTGEGGVTYNWLGTIKYSMV